MEPSLETGGFFFEKLAISVKTVININLLYQPNLDITFFSVDIKSTGIVTRMLNAMISNLLFMNMLLL